MKKILGWGLTDYDVADDLGREAEAAVKLGIFHLHTLESVE